VLTVSFDTNACIWDAQTGHLLTKLLGHQHRVWSGQFSPDGRQVVTASFDKTARIWDAKTGRPLAKPLVHEQAVWSAQFSPDGRRVLTSSLDQTARVWDANTGLPMSEPLKHDDAVWSAQFSPDGRRIVTASQDKTARVWDTDTGQAVSEPLKHRDAVLSAQFSPDGQRVVTTSADGTARIWEFPTVSLPVPGWLPQITEALAGKRFNDLGIAEPVPFVQLQELQRQLSKSSASDVWTRWMKWFFAEPAARTISPFSGITVSEYVQRRIEENTLDGLKVAVKLSPTNGLALARLARAFLTDDPGQPRRIAEADRNSLLAMKSAPDEAEAWWARAEVLEQAGNLAQALEAIQGAIKLQNKNAGMWHSQGRMLEKTNRNDEAYQSFTRAIDLVRADSTSQGHTLADYYLSRHRLLKKQNHLAEAGVDLCLARNIPVRDPQTETNLIDLSPYYNAPLTEGWQTETSDNDLSELPRGIQMLAGVRFDVRGLIQVGTESRTAQKYPTKVVIAATQRTCQRLHFLHAAVVADEAPGVPDGTRIGSYVIHFINGERAEIPIIIGQSLADWFTQPNEGNKSFTIAWTGNNAQSRRRGRNIRLFKSTWQNPAPTEAILGIDFISTRPDGPWPFLVAITAE